MRSLDVAKIKKELEVYEFPVLELDANKDEFKGAKSFFVYDPNGTITQGENRLQYRIGFTLMFVTLEEEEVDEIQVIEQLRDTGLIFDNAVRDFAKFRGTDDTASTITWNFHSIQRVKRL